MSRQGPRAAPPEKARDAWAECLAKSPADRELDWFFNLAESAMGARTNFLSSPRGEEDTIEDRAEAAHAQRRIYRWLWEVGDHDAGVLHTAYAARPWPLALREALGRVTGVVVRLASVEVGLPGDDRELDALELRTAARLHEALERLGPQALSRFRPKGEALLASAFKSYVRERGGGGKPIPGVT